MDYMISATAAEGTVRAYAAQTTALCEEARRRHDTWPTATAALGRALTGAGLMGMMLGENESILLQFMGDGPVSPVVAWGNAHGQVRGYVSDPHVHLPLNEQGKLDVAGVVGSDGQLHVIRDLGLRDPYHGTVPIVSGEIGMDLASYFLQSEQLPSAVGLGVLVNPDNTVAAAGGFIVQIMPGASEQIVSRIEHAAREVKSVTSLVSAGRLPEQIIEQLLGGLSVQVTGKYPIAFDCQCSHERFKRHLISLGLEELERLYEEGDNLELRCQFCNEAYSFTAGEMRAIITDLKG